MGSSIDLNKFNYNELKEKLIEEFSIDNSDGMLDKILLSFGDLVGNTYFILNNQYWEDNNSYYGCGRLIDKYYKLNGSFTVFVDLGEESTAANNDYHEVADELGIYDIAFNDDEEEEDE